MTNKIPPCAGVLLCRHDPDIQFNARKFIENDTARIDVITAEDPLHLFFHQMGQDTLEVLCAHLAAFLKAMPVPRIILAGGRRPEALTDGEVHFKLESAACHLRERFPAARIEALFVNQQTGAVEQVFPSAA